MKQWRTTAVELISPVALLLIWQALALGHVIDVRFWPAPTTILASLWAALGSGGLLHDLWLTTTRLVIGVAIGTGLGLVVGLSMGLWRLPRLAFRPLIAMTYPIPKIAILPLFLLVFGLGEASKWAIVATGAFYVEAINTFAGVREIDAVYRETATIYRISWWRQVRTVLVPGALGPILTGLELGIGVGFLLVVAAEFVGSGGGLGFAIWQAWETLNIPQMYAGLTVIAVYGFVVESFVRWLDRRLVPWRRTTD